jgi:hypothetical protein
MIYMCKVEMAACNKQIDADDLNDAIDELSALILTLPAKTTDLEKLKEGILAIKKEANPCGLENNNNGNNNNNNNTNNASNPGSSRSRKRSTRKRKFYRR